MKKKLITLLLLVGLLSSLMAPAYAETFSGDDDWNVSFTQGETMVSNFKTNDIDDVILGMQPGDNAIITLDLRNDHDETTNWYMTNKVLDSLEDDSLTAKGGAYTYILSYTDHQGNETLLFSSDTVGGEHISKAGEGLNEATDALKEFFYLDTLEKGQSGSIYLEVALDGETQGNAYQDTLADLQMNFAVELNPTNLRDTTTPRADNPDEPGKIVKTGDENEILPYVIAAGVSGVLLLIFAIITLKRRKQEDEEQEEV